MGPGSNNGAAGGVSSKVANKPYSSNIDNLNSESAMNNNNLLANQISGNTGSSTLAGGGTPGLGNSISGTIISNSGISSGGSMNSSGGVTGTAAAGSK